jgi:hypothetical protein
MLSLSKHLVWGSNSIARNYGPEQDASASSA